MAIRRYVRAALPGLLVLAAVAAVFAQGNRPSQAPDEFRRLLAMGTKYKTATEFYAALKAAAPGGGRQLPAFNQLPDWSGLWTAGGGGNFFSPGPGGVAPKLTPQAAAALKQGQSNEKAGIEYDENLSQCGPPGYPRWLVIPFLREFIVRPEETWLTSETVNNVRRGAFWSALFLDPNIEGVCFIEGGLPATTEGRRVIHFPLPAAPATQRPK
jgi:hypothetical protein